LEVLTIPTTCAASDSEGKLMERFYKTITDIQQGRTAYQAWEWVRIVDESRISQFFKLILHFFGFIHVVSEYPNFYNI
jgi:hypothetical protein